MTIVKNILAVVLGLVIGSAVNMAIVMFSPIIVPPPAGVDVSSAESIAASMELYEAKHFIPPFLAHALGTLTGAIVSFLIAASHSEGLAYVIGVAFLMGGIAASFMIPAPVWFIAVDILLAYIPMAWCGIYLARRINRKGQI